MKYNNWETVRLGDVCGYENSRVSIAMLDDYNYISTENMQPNKGGVCRASSLPSVSAATKFLKGQTLVSNIRPYFKKIWFADKDGGCSNDVLCFRLNKDIDNKYFYYLLSQDSFFDYVMSGSKGTKMPRGDRDQIMQFEFMLPPIEEQGRIAGILGALDDKIECNNRINRNLEEQAAVLFRRWFVDFEFPDPDPTSPTYGKPYRSSGGTFIDSCLGKIPTSWKVERLSDLCISVSKTHTKDRSALVFLNTGDIENGKFLHSLYSDISIMPGQAKKSIIEGDILYSEIRPINRHFAYVNFPSQDYVVSTKLIVIRSVNINSRRLYQYLTSQSVIDILQHEAESRSGTFPQIRFDNIQQLSMVVAPAHVEKKYTNYLISIYNHIDQNITENRILAELRDSLLPKLMNGLTHNLTAI